MIRDRPATREDIPALSELVLVCDEAQRSWAGDVPIPTLEQEALEWDLRLARTDAWTRLREEDGEIVAVVAWAAATETRASRVLVPGLAHVSAVFTHPSQWRRGVARALLAEAEQGMRDAGYDRAQLWTLEGSPAEHLYRALGWTADGRREPYPPMGLTVVAYTKDVSRT